MFETGMSALVLKICSEYAKSLGLNFPPCTQQEINAICEWVDKHTVKDMAISQDGYNVTFTFKGEYDTTKEFTITIPKTIDVEELAKVLVGSESVVVERLENNSGLRVRLDQSVLDNINSKLTKPTNPSAESAVTMLADGTVGTKLLSEIGGGGGGKLYIHNLTFTISNTDKAYLVLYTSNYSNSFDLTSLKTFLTKHSNALKNTVGIYFVSNTEIALFSSISIMGGSDLTGYKYEFSGSRAIKVVTSVADTVTEL